MALFEFFDFPLDDSSLDMLTPPSSPRCDAFVPSFAPLDAKELSFAELSLTLSRASTPTNLTPPGSPQPFYDPLSMLELKSDPVYNEVMSLLSDCSEAGTPAVSVASSPAPAPPTSPVAGSSRVRKRKNYAQLFADDEDYAGDDSSPAIVPVSRSKRARTVKPKLPPSDGESGKPARRTVDKEILSKRDSHNISERQRRKELKNSFECLRRSIPALADNPRVHTASILQNAIETIAQLQREEAELEAEKAALRAAIKSQRARAH